MIQPWPVVGRDAEVAAILDDLRFGRGAVITGEAGVGKTILAREVQRRLDAQQWRTELLRCSARQGLSLPQYVRAEPDPVRSGKTARAPLGSDAPAALIVDDAHLLDDESAELLWRVASGGGTRVVATVRLGERAPDRVARLWVDGECGRLDLLPLTESDVRLLLELVLDGDVEDRLAHVLFGLAAGNALLLRELVRSGIDSRAIARSQEVWRLAGELPVGAAAADIIRATLDSLDEPELEAARLLAIGEPLRLDIADALIGHQLMEALEDQRVAAVLEVADGPVLTLSHPLYGDVLRGSIAPLRRRRLRGELIAAIRDSAHPHPQDVLRAVTWRVELGESPDPIDLLEAARAARTFSHATAERLARAALSMSGSVDALVLLAEILVMQGRVAEAEGLFEELTLDALSAADRQTVLYNKALCRTRLGEVSGVVAMITGSTVNAGATSLQLQAIYAQALMLDGRIDEGLVAARPLLTEAQADAPTRTMATNAVCAGSSYVGRVDAAVAAMGAVLSAAEQVRDVLPFGLGNVLVATAIGLAAVGRVDEADKIAGPLYERSLAEDDEWLRPRGASGLGVAALFRGKARTATRYFRIAVASLNALDGQYLCYNLSFLARGAALGGFVDEARRALETPAEAPRFMLFEAEWLLAEAALLAAEGAFTAAGERALDAARHAASIGAWVTVSLAAHDAARYSADPAAVPLVAAAAERVEGLLQPLLVDFARARSLDDPLLLTSVGDRFAAMGMTLFAAEATYAAATAYRSAGDGRAAARTIARAAELHAACENAVIPWVADFQSGEVLTRREQQIALLAAAGSPDAAIAADLEISVRTVQNHLGRVYRKLGITRRGDLANALG